MDLANLDTDLVLFLGQQNVSAQPVDPAGMPGAANAPAMAAAQPAAVPGTTTQTTAPGVPPAQQPNLLNLALPFLLVIGVMVLMTWMSSKKESKRRAAMYAGMKRGDQVQLTGGMIGTITEIGDNDIVVRFEEGRIRFLKSAVASVLKESKGSAVAEVKNAKNTANAGA